MNFVFLKISDTFHTQYRNSEHVHEEVSGKKKVLGKMAALSNLAILYDLCIGSAYAGKWLVPQLFLKQSDTFPTQYRYICMKKFMPKI